MYFANGAGVNPGKADVALTWGTLILESSTDSVNEKKGGGDREEARFWKYKPRKDENCNGGSAITIGCEDSA